MASGVNLGLLSLLQVYVFQGESVLAIGRVAWGRQGGKDKKSTGIQGQGSRPILQKLLTFGQDFVSTKAGWLHRFFSREGQVDPILLVWSTS